MNNITALKSPAYLAYENADHAQTEIRAEARRRTAQFVANWLVWMEDEFPDNLDKLASDAACAEFIEQALLERVKLPKPHEAADDAREIHTEQERD